MCETLTCEDALASENLLVQSKLGPQGFPGDVGFEACLLQYSNPAQPSTNMEDRE